MTRAGPLAVLAADPGRAGVFTDFDGTLSPIVDDPTDARPLPTAPETLVALAAALAHVGVISGRPASFLRRQLPGAPEAGIGLYGLHGLEAVGADGAVVGLQGAEAWRPAIREAVASAEWELGGVAEVEDKDLALTVHFRRNPAAEAQVAEWARKVASASRLVVHPARMSYELRPPVPHGKGVVLESAARAHRLTAACFCGDDAGDLDAFDALDRLVAATPGFMPVKVAVTSPEAPPALLERADVVVAGPEGVVELLAGLADAVRT